MDWLSWLCCQTGPSLVQIDWARRKCVVAISGGEPFHHSRSQPPASNRVISSLRRASVAHIYKKRRHSKKKNFLWGCSSSIRLSDSFFFFICFFSSHSFTPLHHTTTMAEIDQAAIEAVQDQLEAIAAETEKVELELGMFSSHSHQHQAHGLQTNEPINSQKTESDPKKTNGTRINSNLAFSRVLSLCLLPNGK